MANELMVEIERHYGFSIAMPGHSMVWADPSPLPPWKFRTKQRSPKIGSQSQGKATLTYWLNSSVVVRHNSTCEHYGKTRIERASQPDA